MSRLLLKFGTLVPAPGSDAGWLDEVGPEGAELTALVHGPGILVAAQAGGGGTSWWAGDLRTSSVIEVVTLLSGAGETGSITVHGARGTRTLFLEAGEYLGGNSSHDEDRLGEVLWRGGRISLDQLMIAAASLEPGKRIGRALVELGYLDPRDLRAALWRQARAVFEAACLEGEGIASFVRGVRSPNPIRWGVGIDTLLDESIESFGEVAALRDRLDPLVAPCRPVVPAPPGKLDEPCEALLQLANSAKETLTRMQLVHRAGLGTRAGLKALGALVDGGYFQSSEPEPVPQAEAPSRVRGLAAALNLVMARLNDHQGGPGDSVRAFLDEPPEHLAEALSSISLDEELEPEALEIQAGFSAGGLERMESAMVVLLDFALFEARDCLPEDESDHLDEEVAALGLFP